MGLNLSFRVESIGPRNALLLIVFATIVLVLPTSYGIGYAFLGGAHLQTTRKLQQIVAGNATRDAQDAIRRRDYRLITTRSKDNFDVLIPGVGLPDPQRKQQHGYLPMDLLYADTLTPAEKRLNADAAAYASQYNRALIAYVRIPVSPTPPGGSGPATPGSSPGQP